LILLCFCCGCWAFGFGLECPMASRWLQEAGRSEKFIGFNTGAHFLGVLLMGVFAPALIRRRGRGCILTGLLLSGLGVMAFPLGGGPAGWFALRLLAGAGGALAMIGLETLINLEAPPSLRSRYFASYACSVGLGFALGSFAGLHVFSVSPPLSFVLGGGVTLLAVPVVLFLPAFPHYVAAEETGPLPRAPLLSSASAWCQGFLEAVMLAFLPLYLISVGMSDGACGNLLGVILVGVLLGQAPIGWLADRVGRERVLIGCFVTVGLGLAAAPNADREVGLPVWLVVIGIFSGAFYPLGLALLGERIPASQLPQANAWYLGINCFGSLVSPPVSGWAMEHFGPASMFWICEIVIVGALLLWLLSSKRVTASRKQNLVGRQLRAASR